MTEYLTIENVSKYYQSTHALVNLSVSIPKASIFGLLGPNGAGKTTLIRIINQIIGADSGKIILHGEELNSRHIAKIGYMPEERGLYSNMKVGEHLVYLAQLKGINHHFAKKKIQEWFEKFEIMDWWNKKIRELSKGMQQKIQFIATVVHEPELIILDEPFSGLDPLNSNLIKEEISALREKGATIIFSTHRMEQVEEICELIILVNKGSKILEGSVYDIKQRYKKNIFKFEYEGVLNPDDSFDYEVISDDGHTALVQTKENCRPNELLKRIIDKVEVHSFSEMLPTLNEIFIAQINNQNEISETI